MSPTSASACRPIPSTGRCAGQRGQHPGYIQKAGKGSVVAESVAIDAERAVEDYCFLALRRRVGIDYGDYARRFGKSIEADFGPVINQLVCQGLLERTAKGCCLSEEGLGYGNYVFSKFIR